MIEEILKLYTAGMAGQVHSPVPLLFGPPGSGKSSVVQEAGRRLGVKVHIINVSRLSPLELEGVQLPEEGKLRLLLASNLSIFTMLLANMLFVVPAISRL